MTTDNMPLLPDPRVLHLDASTDFLYYNKADLLAYAEQQTKELRARINRIVRSHRNDYNGAQIDPILDDIARGTP